MTIQTLKIDDKELVVLNREAFDDLMEKAGVLPKGLPRRQNVEYLDCTVNHFAPDPCGTDTEGFGTTVRCEIGNHLPDRRRQAEACAGNRPAH